MYLNLYIVIYIYICMENQPTISMQSQTPSLRTYLYYAVFDWSHHRATLRRSFALCSSMPALKVPPMSRCFKLRYACARAYFTYPPPTTPYFFLFPRSSARRRRHTAVPLKVWWTSAAVPQFRRRI